MRVEVDDGVGLAVDVLGSGPLLLCVHGLGGAKEDFADHLPTLARRTTVASLDLRGHGQSDRAPGSYTLDRLAADVLAVADRLGPGPVRLVGHSMGGMVVRRAVVAAPGRVAGVVFMSTVAGPPAGLDPDLVDLGADLARRDWDALRALLDETRPLGTSAYERLLADRPGFAAYLARKWACLDPEAWAALAPQVAREPDARADLAGLACPTSVVVGALDAVFLEGARALAAAVPHATLVELPDAGHHPQFEQPAAWLAAIEDWLDVVDATARPGAVAVPEPGGTT